MGLGARQEARSWPIHALGVAWVVCLITTIYFAASRNFEQVQRAGTLFISIGVIGLAWARPKLKELEEAASSYQKKISDVVRSRALAIAKEELADMEDLNLRETYEVVRLVEREGGMEFIMRGFSRFEFNFEILTILLGTILTGYGDKIAEYIMGTK